MSWDQKYACRPFVKYTTSKTGTMSRVYNTSGVDSRGCIDVPTRLQYFKIKGMLLTLQGSRVDQIETTLDRDYAVTLQASIDIIDSWSPVDGDSPYISGETKLDAFLRTIVADVTEDKVYADLPVEAQRGFRVNAVDKTLDSSHVDAFHITKWTQFRRLATSMKGYMGSRKPPSRSRRHHLLSLWWLSAIRPTAKRRQFLVHMRGLCARPDGRRSNGDAGQWGKGR